MAIERRAFTMTELLVTIGIMTILLTILVVAVGGVRETARVASTRGHDRHVPGDQPVPRIPVTCRRSWTMTVVWSMPFRSRTRPAVMARPTISRRCRGGIPTPLPRSI